MSPKRSARKQKTPAIRPAASPSPKTFGDFLIVAVGASAGGLQAFTELIGHLPPDTGVAFVLIQHLDPKHPSMLSELLSRESVMVVAEAKDAMKIVPNHVYVIPPNTSMSITDHSLHLAPRGNAPGVHMSVDHFMRSLAEHQGNCGIGVILSGTGTDGTLGVAEIQSRGGVTFAQDPATAKYDSMPRSAIAAGHVDYVLSPKEIARELCRIAKHPYVARTASEEETQSQVSRDNSDLAAIFQILRRSTGVDFTHYRQTTILRRLQRRMLVHKLDNLTNYVEFLQSNPSEVATLYQDILISVTSFFRTPKVFDSLRSQVFPDLVKHKPFDREIRVWTPGCSSGEETYSLAISLLEFLGDGTSGAPVQLFGTDVSESNIDKARSGVYPQNIREDVSPDRLQRFFKKVEAGYQISQNIRDICIFARHNLISDPPFSRIDLICCRNLLIYLEPVLQNKVISLFHYALRPGGWLLLGPSEGVGTATNLFTPVDRTNKIFDKKAAGGRQVVTFSLQGAAESAPLPFRDPVERDSIPRFSDLQKEFDRRLLMQYAPAAVFIDEDSEILHTRGNVNRYLKISPGRPSLNLLKMAADGLQFDLQGAIIRAKKENRPVKKQNVPIKSDPGTANGPSADASRFVNFEVIPLSAASPKELHFMVVLEDSPASLPSPPRSSKSKKDFDISSSRFRRIEQELAATREHLQAVIETHEATNEELQSANEEILSSNEELQSTNEELETAKEELQSANEELTTVNDELRIRNMEVNVVNNDLTNLLASIDIAVLMLANDLTIRRFTQRAEALFSLIPGDVGRPLLNINPTLKIPDLEQILRQVAGDSIPVEKTIIDPSGNRFQLRVLPYRTAGNSGNVDGAVITLVDLSQQDGDKHERVS